MVVVVLPQRVAVAPATLGASRHGTLALDDVLEPDGRPREGHAVLTQPVAGVVCVRSDFVDVLLLQQKEKKVGKVNKWPR